MDQGRGRGGEVEKGEGHTVQLAQNSVHSAGAASARHADIELVCVVCHLSYLSISLHSILLSSVLRCSGVSIGFSSYGSEFKNFRLA
jgi:hypothetical protein